MAARRLAAPLDPASEPGPIVGFTFDGRTIAAPAGEPLAVSLLAAGHAVLSRSFRFHRPRGLMCSTGQCGWCECNVDGVPSVRTCRVPIREGLLARGEHAWPSVERDVFALLGLGAGLVRPTFYHHRFLRPKALRKAYLDAIRLFGGRGRLATSGWRGEAPSPRPLRSVTVDVLVVGGGPAGIRAALDAARPRASVMLIEADDELRGPSRELLAAGVDVQRRTAAIGVYDRNVLALGPVEQLEVTARTVVGATGSYELVPTVPGNDRPGVLAARTVEWLIRRWGVVPGDRAVLVGASDDVRGARAALEAAGSSVVDAVPTRDLARIGGTRRVTGIRLVGGRRIAADVVVFGDRTPALDLAMAAGAVVERRDGRLVAQTDADGVTSVPWLSLVGSARGEAGRDRPIAGREPHPRALVCFCEDVHAGEIRAEIAAGHDHPEELKRRTGALTGPCQGKYCLGPVTACLAGGGAPSITTARPPLRPVRLGDLVTDGVEAPSVPVPDTSKPGGASGASPWRHRPGARADVVIIGGGIAGLALARELVASGVGDVTIAERAYPGGGATGRNVARIRAMQLTAELTRIALAAQQKYDRMAGELGFNVLFYRGGYAWLLYAADELARMGEIVAMHHRIGLRSRLLDPDDALRLLPVLRGGETIAGAVFHHRDGIVHHDAVVWAHLEHLRRTAVRLLTGTPVIGVHRDGDRVAGVRTSAGDIATELVVNATDGWSRSIAQLAGVRAPNRPLRREVLVTAPIQRSIEAAATFYRPQEGWFNQTLRGEIVMGVVDPDEPAGIDQRSSAAFLRRTARVIGMKAPALADTAVIRQWAGMYDVTPDHLPLVGPTGQLRGFWQMNGWSGRGMLLAPLAAELLARWIASGAPAAPPPMLGQFLPDRFPGDADAAPDDADYYARYRRP